MSGENDKGVILGNIMTFSVGVKQGKVFVISSIESRLVDMVKEADEIKRLKALLQFAINDLDALDVPK